MSTYCWELEEGGPFRVERTIAITVPVPEDAATDPELAQEEIERAIHSALMDNLKPLPYLDKPTRFAGEPEKSSGPAPEPLRELGANEVATYTYKWFVDVPYEDLTKEEVARLKEKK